MLENKQKNNRGTWHHLTSSSGIQSHILRRDKGKKNHFLYFEIIWFVRIFDCCFFTFGTQIVKVLSWKKSNFTENYNMQIRFPKLTTSHFERVSRWYTWTQQESTHCKGPQLKLNCTPSIMTIRFSFRRHLGS